MIFRIVCSDSQTAYRGDQEQMQLRIPAEHTATIIRGRGVRCASTAIEAEAVCSTVVGTVVALPAVVALPVAIPVFTSVSAVATVASITSTTTRR